MSSIGSPGSPTPAQISALQAVQTQHVASTARDRDKARTAEARRALQDHVDLRVEGLETNTAVRQVPQNNSEQEREEHESHEHSAESPGDAKAKSKSRRRIDVKA